MTVAMTNKELEGVGTYPNSYQNKLCIHLKQYTSLVIEK